MLSAQPHQQLAQIDRIIARTIQAERRATERDRLGRAYERPCFICSTIGSCHHRQAEVEIAILNAGVKERAQ